MNKERELLRKILKANNEGYLSFFGFASLKNTIENLLAQPEQDLEALKKDWVNFGYVTGKREQLLVQPEPEPVAWMSLEKGDVNKSRSYFEFVEKYQDENIVPLYTSPLTRKPLSLEELCKLYGDNVVEDIFTFARAIEKAHGIGGGE